MAGAGCLFAAKEKQAELCLAGAWRRAATPWTPFPNIIHRLTALRETGWHARQVGSVGLFSSSESPNEPLNSRDLVAERQHAHTLPIMMSVQHAAGASMAFRGQREGVHRPRVRAPPLRAQGPRTAPTCQNLTLLIGNKNYSSWWGHLSVSFTAISPLPFSRLDPSAGPPASPLRPVQPTRPRAAAGPGLPPQVPPPLALPEGQRHPLRGEADPVRRPTDSPQTAPHSQPPTPHPSAPQSPRQNPLVSGIITPQAPAKPPPKPPQALPAGHAGHRPGRGFPHREGPRAPPRRRDRRLGQPCRPRVSRRRVWGRGGGEAPCCCSAGGWVWGLPAGGVLRAESWFPGFSGHFPARAEPDRRRPYPIPTAERFPEAQGWPSGRKERARVRGTRAAPGENARHPCARALLTCECAARPPGRPGRCPRRCTPGS